MKISRRVAATKKATPFLADLNASDRQLFIDLRERLLSLYRPPVLKIDHGVRGGLRAAPRRKSI